MFPSPLEILMAWTLNARRRFLAPVLEVLDEMEARLMTRADDLVARFNAATNDLAGDLREIRAALEEATSGSDSKVAQAVNAVLDRFEAPITALEELGADDQPPTPAGPGPSDGGDGVPAGPVVPDPDLHPADDPEFDDPQR